MGFESVHDTDIKGKSDSRVIKYLQLKRKEKSWGWGWDESGGKAEEIGGRGRHKKRGVRY